MSDEDEELEELESEEPEQEQDFISVLAMFTRKQPVDNLNEEELQYLDDHHDDEYV